MNNIHRAGPLCGVPPLRHLAVAAVVNAHEKSKVGVIREKEKVSKVLDDLNLKQCTMDYLKYCTV